MKTNVKYLKNICFIVLAVAFVASPVFAQVTNSNLTTRNNSRLSATDLLLQRRAPAVEPPIVINPGRGSVIPAPVTGLIPGRPVIIPAPVNPVKTPPQEVIRSGILEKLPDFSIAVGAPATHTLTDIATRCVWYINDTQGLFPDVLSGARIMLRGIMDGNRITNISSFDVVSLSPILVQMAETKIAELNEVFYPVAREHHAMEHARNNYMQMCKDYVRLTYTYTHNDPMLWRPISTTIFPQLDIIWKEFDDPFIQFLDERMDIIHTLTSAIANNDWRAILANLDRTLRGAENISAQLRTIASSYNKFSDKIAATMNAIRAYESNEEYRMLCKEALKKIDEHTGNINTITNNNSFKDTVKAGYDATCKDYERMFALLPEGHNFKKLILGIPDLGIPMEAALAKSNLEIQILRKAIDEVDLDTIKTHLNNYVSEVGMALNGISTLIQMYNKQSSILKYQMVQIMAYLENYQLTHGIKAEAQVDGAPDAQENPDQSESADPTPPQTTSDDQANLAWLQEVLNQIIDKNAAVTGGGGSAKRHTYEQMATSGQKGDLALRWKK